MSKVKQIKNKVSDNTTYKSNPSLEIQGVIESFIKLPLRSIEIVTTLSIPALKVFCYISFNLPVGQDRIYLDMNHCATWGGYTNPTSLYKGIAELLEKCVIYRHVGHKSLYFINVNFVYKQAA